MIIIRRGITIIIITAMIIIYIYILLPVVVHTRHLLPTFCK